MNQCEAKRSDGARCRRRIKKGQRYCGHHAGFDWKKTGAVAAGAAIGTMLSPGPGTLIGGVVGGVLDYVGLAMRAKKNVFLSFDFHQDRRMKTMFVGQCKNPKSPFNIVDCSLQEAAPEAEWIEHAMEAIAGCDLVIVLIGRHTYRANGVLIEVEIARRLGVPTVQVWAYRDGRGITVSGAGDDYPWDWAVLDHVLE